MQVNQVRLGAVLSYVSMGLSTLISLIYTPIMLDRLGETEYGVYGAVGPIISYLLLLSMGLGSAISATIPRPRWPRTGGKWPSSTACSW